MYVLTETQALLTRHALTIAASVRNTDTDLPENVSTLLLISPDGPRFWQSFKNSPEYTDTRPDPLDRWSLRVINALAEDLGARALYPFGTTPPHPFYRWALASRQIWASPVQWLVHPDAGLWLSFRAALAFERELVLPPVSITPPCLVCPKPCAYACPVGALTERGYDTQACHAYLDTVEGENCLREGCAVRAACPVSQTHGRNPEQSAFHMRHFHP